jgi:lipopolysaccharide export system permease protein
MRLIDRYLLRQLLGPVVLATLALTAVALLSQSLAGLDLIVNQRQSALVFLKVTLLYMPQLINLILPVAVFVAAPGGAEPAAHRAGDRGLLSPAA